MRFKKKTILLIALTLFATLLSTSALAVGEGPNYQGHETVNNSRFTTHEEMTDMLQKCASKSDLLSVEVIGQSIKGRDLFLAKFGNNPENPTVLFVTQQHGNEIVSTEAALEFIKKLSTSSSEVRDWVDKVNILVVPMINPDGGAGDVNFNISNYAGGGLCTRANANGYDLNRDHWIPAQPETIALHNNVLSKYRIDYAIDFHHQGTQSAINNEYVSGSMLYPTNNQVSPEIVLKSKQLGAVVYNAIESRGFGLIGRYNGTTDRSMVRNAFPMRYGIAALLIEQRGMADHNYLSYVLGQKSNGYLIKQVVISMEAAVSAIADGSINEADVSFWDTLPLQRNKVTEEEEFDETE